MSIGQYAPIKHLYQNESNGNKSVFILLLLLYILYCTSKKKRKYKNKKSSKAGLSLREISSEQHLDGNFANKNLVGVLKQNK